METIARRNVVCTGAVEPCFSRVVISPQRAVHRLAIPSGARGRTLSSTSVPIPRGDSGNKYLCPPSWFGRSSIKPLSAARHVVTRAQPNLKPVGRDARLCLRSTRRGVSTAPPPRVVLAGNVETKRRLVYQRRPLSLVTLSIANCSLVRGKNVSTKSVFGGDSGCGRFCPPISGPTRYGDEGRTKHVTAR